MDEVCECWAYCCGTVTPYIRDSLAQLLAQLDGNRAVLIACIRITGRAPRPSLAYLGAVIRNRKAGYKPWEAVRPQRAPAPTPLARKVQMVQFVLKDYSPIEPDEVQLLAMRSPDSWVDWPHLPEEYRRQQLAKLREDYREVYTNEQN